MGSGEQAQEKSHKQVSGPNVHSMQVGVLAAERLLAEWSQAGSEVSLFLKSPCIHGNCVN